MPAGPPPRRAPLTQAAGAGQPGDTRLAAPARAQGPAQAVGGDGAAGAHALGLLDLRHGRTRRADRVEQLRVLATAGGEIRPVFDVHTNSRSNRAATASGGALTRPRAGSSRLMICCSDASTRPR